MDEVQLELEAFTKAARGSAESELSLSARPDFDEVWSAMQRLEAAELERDDPELFEWVAAARGEAEADLDLASRRAVPPLPLTAGEATPSETRSAGALWWVGWLAAAVALFFGGQWALRANQGQPEGVHQAEREVKMQDDGGEAIERPVEVEEATPLSLPEDAPIVEPEPEAPATDTPSDEKLVRAEPKTRPHRSRKERLRELDERAQALWRAGDLDGSQALFEQIVDKGGKSSLADLAYGDLLTLARQRGTQAREVQLWREYLKVFPHGRHADDATAGLCRREGQADAVECWNAYLEKFPQGSHRRAAQKARESADMPGKDLP